MSPLIEILDAAGVGALRFADPSEERRRCCLAALLEDGARGWVENVDAEVLALRVGSSVASIVVPEPRARNADACSPYTWYVRYPVTEAAKRGGRSRGAITLARHLPMAGLLALGDVDRCVLLGSGIPPWGPPPEWPADVETAVIECLRERWPDRAILRRGLCPAIDPAPARTLAARGYRLVRSRRVSLVDLRGGSLSRWKNVRIDQARLHRDADEIVDDPDRLRAEARRIVDLHRAVYVDAHVPWSPRPTERFFTQTLAAGTIRGRGLFRHGRLDGFVTSFHGGGVTWSSLLGYDVTSPRGDALYRKLIALLYREGAERRAILHLGSGAEHFKRLRGAILADEFDAVFDAHLPLRRRLAWRVLAAVSNRSAVSAAAVPRATRTSAGRAA